MPEYNFSGDVKIYQSPSQDGLSLLINYRHMHGRTLTSSHMQYSIRRINLILWFKARYWT